MFHRHVSFPDSRVYFPFLWLKTANLRVHFRLLAAHDSHPKKIMGLARNVPDFLNQTYKNQNWNVMAGGDGFLGRGDSVCLKIAPQICLYMIHLYILIVKLKIIFPAISIPLRIVKMPQFMANSYKGVEKYIPTFFLSAWLTLSPMLSLMSRCHSCPHVFDDSWKGTKKLPDLAQHQFEKRRPIPSKTSTRQQGLGLEKKILAMLQIWGGGSELRPCIKPQQATLNICDGSLSWQSYTIPHQNYNPH